MIDNNKVEVTKMTLENFEEIKDILISEFDDFWNTKTLEDELKNDNSYYIVAKFDNTIIGFAGLKYVLDEADIMNIVTKKNARSCGIGSILFEHLLNYAKENGIIKITLEVNENNVAAINLYKKFGFEQIAKRENYYNGIDTAIIMQKRFN